MNDQLRLKDYIIYIIPGYIWLGTLSVTLGIVGMSSNVLFSKFFSLSNIIITIPLAYLCGQIGSYISEIMHPFLGGSIKKIKENKYKNNSKSERINEKVIGVIGKYGIDKYQNLYEIIEHLLDDAMSISGIRNSWSRYHDLAQFMKYVFTSGVFFSLSLVIGMFLSGMVSIGIVISSISILILLLVRSRYHKYMCNYLREIQLSFLLVDELRDDFKIKT